MKQRNILAELGINPVPLAAYMRGGRDGVRAQCEQIARNANETGLILVEVPEFPWSVWENMGQMGTAYLQQPDEVKMRDCRPDQAFQVGIMGESGDGGEKATSYDDVIARIPPGHEPLTIGMGDRKNRFFHRIGDGDPSSIFTVANAPNVTPEAFSDIWATTCDAYGNFLLQVFMTVLEMAAIGVGAPKNLFTPLMRHGQHLVSIGGANLSKYTEPGVCINGFHDDLNFATLHTPAFPVIGKGRRAEACPGLFAYTRDLRRFPVVIPRGCVLLQVAQQWERVTGGHFLAGFHEVVTVPEHERFRLVAESAGMQAWRCATVVFGAAGSDQVLRPLGPFATREAEERYPGMFAALSTARKLVKIGMMPAAVLAGIEEQAIAHFGRVHPGLAYLRGG